MAKEEKRAQKSGEKKESLTDSPASEVKSEANHIESLLMIDEHVEEVSENGQKVRHKGIFLLPNLFTSAALFSGFYAIISAINSDFASAGLAIFFGQILDGLDGRIARLTNSQSKFGEEYDSLSDMVTFGVAPALIMFLWCLSELGKLGWTVAFVYVACAALRLARFNAQADTADSRFFTGLASPPAAMLIVATVWVCADWGLMGAEMSRVGLGVFALETAIVGVLMVVNVPYHSFKGLDFKGRVPFVVVLLATMVFVVIATDPPLVLFCLAFVYALSGPVAYVWRKVCGKQADGSLP